MDPLLTDEAHKVTTRQEQQSDTKGLIQTSLVRVRLVI